MSSSCDFIPGLPTNTLFPADLLARLQQERIAAVVTLENATDAVPLARALADGGVRVIELAWRTRDALEAMAAIKRAVPEILLGTGTLLTPEQVRMAHAAKVDFGVSPGLSRAVVSAARDVGLPFAPGVQTASDLHAAVELGCRFLKYFPAESAGGLAHLRNLHAPFAHLGLRYFALGGINEQNVAAYLREPVISTVGGSWIAAAPLLRERAWDAIRQRAAAARALVDRRD